MKKVSKPIRPHGVTIYFNDNPELRNRIQLYANDNFNGNFTGAIKDLADKALSWVGEKGATKNEIEE